MTMVVGGREGGVLLPYYMECSSLYILQTSVSVFSTPHQVKIETATPQPATLSHEILVCRDCVTQVKAIATITNTQASLIILGHTPSKGLLSFWL